jgi:hypothetical protein
MLVAGVAYADDFFSSKPGDLSYSHKELDAPDRCNDCHVNGTKDVDRNKCLNCHDHNNLRDRMKAGKGFHASSLVGDKPCEKCHLEHKDRGYKELLGWKAIAGGMDNFNHDLAGWKLNGKHATTKCADCHKKKDKQGLLVFMGTGRPDGTDRVLCGFTGCHANDQPHKFEQSERDKLLCERCHGESVWKPAKQPQDMKFNHNDRKDALMPLIGSHADVSCAKCHPKSVFNLPAAKPDSCGNQGCHVSPHEGHLYNTRPCEWCHSPSFKTLKQQNFDHTEKTRFDLGPAHRKIKCYDCHTKSLGESKPNGACEQCHAKDSHHADRFKEFGSPPKCATCHPSGGPKFTPSNFNHGARTRFKLEYKHAEVACRQCHRGKDPSDFENFQDLIDKNGKVNCMGCHAHKKVHSDPDHPDGKYKVSQCLGCHMHPGDPTIRKGKDNQLADAAHNPVHGTFPLVKGHKDVPCNNCHTGRDKKNKTSFSSVKPNCNAAGQCHEDSLHKGSLGDGCLACHKPGTWDALGFNHDDPFPDDAKGEVKSFPLKGAHRDNKCEECHPKRDFAAAHATCSAEGCHAEDDAHKGRLGPKCERCHVETGDNIFNHNTMSAFHLDGKHLEVRCADCHPSITFKPRPTNCFGCHPEPKVHKGQYGTACEQCHSTKTFSDIKPLHDVGDFSLKGMHDNIACERCHKDNRPLAGSGNLCINCHRQDDVHNNSLSPKCGECHTQWSFAPARFDHTKVGCNLTGLHRTISCASCHVNGNFVGLSPTCVSCHHDDAIKAGDGLNATHSTTQTCTGGGCHNPNSWSPNVGFNRESVCR